jgi:catechol 2,3-dioxygenase-like lactoylglutathione lyase family enzyme
MKRVTGIGGIFFKSDDPEKLYRWYADHLGIERDETTVVTFHSRDADDPAKKDRTMWALFPRSTKYFGTGPATFMMNYRVENLDALLEALAKEGVEIDPHRDDHEYGKFAWIVDPDGNRIELWEPPKEQD